jgi:hypothetical protein
LDLFLSGDGEDNDQRRRQNKVNKFEKYYLSLDDGSSFDSNVSDDNVDDDDDDNDNDNDNDNADADADDDDDDADDKADDDYTSKTPNVFSIIDAIYLHFK